MKKPDILSIDITYKCNEKCIMCEVWRIKNQTKNELNTSEIINFINDVLGKYHLKSIRFVGGEPFVRKDLEIIISTIPSKVKTEVITNGTLITRERSKKIIESGVGLVSFSIDGPERVHDYFRGKGSFAKAISGLTNLYNAKKEMSTKHPIIEIRPCISKANIDEINSIIEIANKFEAKLLFSVFLMDMNYTPKDFIDGKEITTRRAKDPNNFALSTKEKADFLRKYYSKDYIEISSIQLAKQKVKNIISERLINQLDINYYDCDRSRRMMIVDPWGDLFTCEFLYGYKYGNVKEGAKVWTSNRRNEIRGKIRNGDLNICRNCNKKNRNRGLREITQNINSFYKFIWSTDKK